MVTTFVCCVVVIVYVYCGYPVMLRSGLLGRRKPIHRAVIEPSVSVVIPAYNEETVIREKIEHLLSLDYPKQKVEILVGSDGSTDQTVNIVREYAARGVRLIARTDQGGKSTMQNVLMKEAKGELVVFTDADCYPGPSALRRLVENFGDPSVGLVSARPIYANAKQSQIGENEGVYWKYENWIRREECDRGLLAVASGSFFAFRRVLWRPLDPDVGDDFVIPLRVAQARLRNIVDERILVHIQLSAHANRSMFRMKKRIISKDLRGLMTNLEAVNPVVVGAVAIGLLSHKLLRWLAPYFLIGVLLSSAALAHRPLFAAFLVLQSAFYGIALLVWWQRDQSVRAPWSIPLSFCVVNGAALAGTIHFFIGGRAGQWKPLR